MSMHKTKTLFAASLLMATALSGCANWPDGELDKGERIGAAAERPAPQRAATAVAAATAEEPATKDGAPRTIVAPGTGRFLKDVGSGKQSSYSQTGPDGDVTLNYVNADVKEVLRDVLGDILHLSYVVDPKVQGAVTVNTGKPLRRDAVLPVLESVLRANGLAMSQAENVVRIMPLDDTARGSSIVFSPGQARPGYGIRIVPLKFTSAGQLQHVLEPYAPPGGKIEADGMRNLLIMSGTRQDLDGLSEIVNLFDVNWISGMSYALFPLKVATPRNISIELDGIFGDTAQGPLAGLVRIVPLERLNSILVITPQPAYLKEAETWIDRLDFGSDEATPRIFNYQVQNSRAADLAEVLTNILSGSDVKTVKPQTAPGTTSVQLGSGSLGGGGGGLSSGFGGSPSSSSSSPSSSAAGSGLLVSGSLPPPPLSTGADSGIGTALGSGTGGARGGTGGARGSSSAGSVASQPSPFGGGRGGQRDAGGEEKDDGPKARIVADEKNNALVIFAKPRDYRMIENVLQKLDVVPLQVLIEATIAEVTLNDELKYGLQYFLKSGQKQFSLTNGGALNALSGVFPGFNFVLGGSRAQAILSALTSISDVNVISSPQLLVLDHHTAALQVGDQVPIVSQTAVSTLTTGAPVVNSVEYRDTGVILQVTPRVNSNGLVTLDISQEVSDVATTTSSSINSPTIQQRKFVSSVVVRDGETIALGGLIKDTRTNTKSGIPFLSQLPVAGGLFSNTDNAKARTELIVLLSPKVIRNDKEAQDMTDELRSRMHAIRPIGLKLH